MTGPFARDKKIAVFVGVFLILFLIFTASVPVYSQATGATLSGTISDPSGAVIPGAQVSIRNTATGLAKETIADSTGFYTLPNLPAGTYEIKVTANGFNTAVESNVTLGVGAQLTLKIPLKVGETRQTLTVTEAAPLIEFSSSTLKGEIESQTVRELPLNGRDWTSLATLQPGVNQIETQMSFDTAARGNRGFGAELTVSGGRPTFNNYRVDGITINDYANSTPGNVLGATLGVDAIQEFSVLTGGFSAEYGRAAGGVVNAITKSGTNAFHGDVYEFFRNSALDSRNYFDRASNNPKATFRRNQFGFAAGMPIIKNKTFIFGDYEGMRQGKGITTSVTVPSDNARLGILAGGTPLTAGAPCAQEANGAKAQNLAPGQATVCVDDSAARMLAMFPHGNGAVSGDRAQFINSALQIVPEDFFTVRVDHKISANDSLFGTYLYDDTDYTQPDSFNNDIINSHIRRQTVVLEESHTFSPALVNTARFGYNRSHVINFKPTGAINSAANDTSLGSTTGQTASRVFIGSGMTGMQGGVGSASSYVHAWNSYQGYDDAFLTHGAHTLKFGAGVERMQYNFLTFQNPGGRWNFGGLTRFLSNQPTHFEAGLPVTISPREVRQTLFGAYIQDDWRIRSNLTLNLGLRYEMATVLNDAQGKITSLVNISDPAPMCGTLFTAPILPHPGSSCASVGPYYSNPTLRNFEPRVGFAWDPFRNGKTSVRGGFGIYDVLPLPGYFLLQQNQAAPFMIFASTNDQPSMAGRFFAGGEELLTNPPPGVAPSKLSLSTVEQNPHRNYVMQANLNIQRQITQDLTVTAGYVGSRGVHLLIRGDDGNMTIPTLTSSGYLFPCGPPQVAGRCTAGNTDTGVSAQVNPVLGILRYIYWGTDSSYNAMYVNVQKRLSHSFQVQVAYTWAKSIDDNSSTIAGDTFANGLNSLFWFAPRALRGLSDFNVGQSWIINGLWDIPTPKSLGGFGNAALGGWEVGSIFRINNGTPTTAILNGDPMGLGNGGADQFGIPNVAPGCDPVNHNFIGSSSPAYFNVSCFTLPTVSSSSPLASQCANFTGKGVPAPPTGAVYCANLLGNSGRNRIIGPRLVNLDFSLLKNNYIPKISEVFNIQFRAEFFNILNHSNFVPPEPINGGSIFNGDGSAGSPGTIDNLATQPRDVQFALKIVW